VPHQPLLSPHERRKVDSARAELDPRVSRPALLVIIEVARHIEVVLQGWQCLRSPRLELFIITASAVPLEKRDSRFVSADLVAHVLLAKIAGIQIFELVDHFLLRAAHGRR